jgi:hypothetical protein
MKNKVTELTDIEYDAALKQLADYERHLIESDRLTQQGSLETGALLAQLFTDPHQRWVTERNAERAATAKTAAGGRPVDPASRSQFSTWLRGRFPAIAPAHVYRLLAANMLVETYLSNGEVTPANEYSIRRLTKLTAVAYGGGKRIEPIWELACQIALDDGHTVPNELDVAAAESAWKAEHVPATQARRETRFAQAERLRIKIKSEIETFIKLATMDQINDVADAFNAAIDGMNQ